MIDVRRVFRSGTTALLIPLIVAASGCASLSYDEPDAAAQAADAAWASDGAGATADAAKTGSAASEDAAPRSARKKTPTRARLAEQDAAADAEEPARSWRELARLARERAQEGQLEEADTLLGQAALQLAVRRPTNTQRRTVFGMRARLAQDMAAFGKTEASDALADRLFEEARREPALGDAALVSLARSTAERRHAAAVKAGRTDDSQLPLLALAFDTAQSGTASRERLALAFEVSGLALRAGELDLARRAIDQCVLDAQVLAPADRMQAAALKVYKARIALAQGDLATAEATAHAATKIFEETGADPANRGVAETTLAQVLARKGETDRGLELARAAYARLSGPDPIVAHAKRQITAGLARVEQQAGDANAASAHFREALAPPADGSTLDADLIREIKAALAELEVGAAPAPASAPAPTSEPVPTPADAPAP